MQRTGKEGSPQTLAQPDSHHSPGLASSVTDLLTFPRLQIHALPSHRLTGTHARCTGGHRHTRHRAQPSHFSSSLSVAENVSPRRQHLRPTRPEVRTRYRGALAHTRFLPACSLSQQSAITVDSPAAVWCSLRSWTSRAPTARQANTLTHREQSRATSPPPHQHSVAHSACAHSVQRPLALQPLALPQRSCTSCASRLAAQRCTCSSARVALHK